MKPLVIDKRDKVKGLFAYCQKCQRIIDNRICGTTRKRLSTCKNTEQHMFKAIVAIPGTDGTKRKTRTFRTRDIQEATRLKYEFVNELEELNYQNSNELNSKKEESKPTLLIDCMAMYIGFLNNVGVEAHKVKVRSTAHIKDVERYFKYFCLSLKHNGIDHTLVSIDQVGEKAVAMIHNYALNELNYKSKTYNKLLGGLRQFINWLINDRNYGITNHFVGVSRRAEIVDKTIVTKDEFKNLLSVITTENGFKTLNTGERKNLYRDWLNHAFRLALETGLRREEFMSIKFNDIILDNKNKPQFIKIENFKVNRINGVSGTEDASMKYVPITNGLYSLLNELGILENKNSNNYLIANDESTSLKTRIDVVSKAFTHFWSFTNSKKNAQLKHLRKTYLTALVKQYGEKANILSSHSGIEVMKKHYLNDQSLINSIDNFSIFQD